MNHTPRVDRYVSRRNRLKDEKAHTRPCKAPVSWKPGGFKEHPRDHQLAAVDV